jgi:hypothetical protein
MAECRRLSLLGDARLATPQLTDTVQTVCQNWLRAQEQTTPPLWLNRLYITRDYSS